MREPNIDDERIAALLDGRLEAGEREALLGRIADSNDEYQVFADAAALLRQQESAGGAAGLARADAPVDRAPSSPPSVVARRRGWRPPAAWMALAAVVASLALIPVLRRADPYDPARLATRLRGLPSDWTASPFHTTRGGEAPNVTDDARAARIGAFLVDLELAVRARDTAAIALYARRVKALADVGTTAAVYAGIEGSAGQPERLPPLLKEGRERMVQVTDEGYREAGAWTEAARIAAAPEAAPDTAFFRRRESRAALDHIAALPSLRDEAREALGRARATLPENRAPDWPDLRPALDDLLRGLGR